MKRLLAILLSFVLVVTGCASSTPISENHKPVGESDLDIEEKDEDSNGLGQYKESTEENGTALFCQEKIDDIRFSGLDDEGLLRYVENAVYSSLIDDLNSEDYFIENVDAVYLSQEYISELAYNTQSNVFFGYTIAELEEAFQGERYVFTLGEDGQTIVTELEEVYDDTYDQVIKNVLIGSGVILICVTVSVATAGVAPAVSMIFAASAITGTTFALQSGTISFVAASLVRGYQTHDFDEAMKAGALAASDGFKWGAIIGGVSGGVAEGIALKGATEFGLTLNEAAQIQRESKWPLEAIKNIHSMKEYTIYKNANLTPTQMSDGSWAFLREIDWKLVDSAGRTNAERVALDLAPLDETGKAYELHHIGQREDGPLAILTWAEHHASENHFALNWAEEGKNISAYAWEKQRKEFWKAVLRMAEGG